MAKETKQDRIVRGVIDQTTEHLHELKSFENNPNIKESDVERWAQSFLKSCLGYMTTSGYMIRTQEAKGKMRPDLIVYKNEKPVFVVEVKKLGYDFEKSDFRSGKIQLNEYLNQIGSVKWGMLTNGYEWKLYDFSNENYGPIEVSAFDLRSDGDVIDMSKKSIEDQCYEFMEFHENSFDNDEWTDASKSALAFSPDSLAKAILSYDVIKYIAKTIRGEHEYKANIELLTDKVYELLEKGLNDAVKPWNEVKQIEYQKFIKSQKRAIKKTKRTKKVVSSEVAIQPSSAPEVLSAEAAQTAVAIEVKSPTVDDKKTA